MRVASLALVALLAATAPVRAASPPQPPACWQRGHAPSAVFLADAQHAVGPRGTGISGDAAAALFAASGITLSEDPPGTVVIADDRQVYSGYGVATAFHDIEIRNVIEQTGRPTPTVPHRSAVSYTLRFASPVQAVAFERVPLIAGPNGTVGPDWTATAYADDGSVVARVGERMIQTYVHIDARMFFLQGDKPIRAVTFAGDHHDFAAYANVVIDALLWCS